jgi:hypothetical protein
VFLIAVPIAALAFLATWLIPQAELTQWPQADQAVPGADVPAAGVGAAVARVSGDAEEALRAPAQPPLTHEALHPQDSSRSDP